MKKQGVVTSQHILLPFTRELPMESFNLEYYRAFYTVAQTGNVTKAAEAAVPVPARRNPLHPPAGGVSWLQVVYPRFPRRAAHRGRHGAFSHVDSAFRSLSNGERELKRLAAFEAGTPIIGAAETPLYHFLLPKLGQFREMHPNVTLQVQGSSTHETIQMLRAEQADVVLAVSPLTDVEDLSVTELASFRDVFVAGPRFKSLAGRHSAIPVRTEPSGAGGLFRARYRTHPCPPDSVGASRRGPNLTAVHTHKQ